MNFSDLPELCTPSEAAEVLRWTRAAVQKACRDGKLACIRLSKNRVLIERSDLAEFLKVNKCPVKTRDSKSGIERTATAGRSGNSSLESVSGEQLIYAVVRKRRRALQNSSQMDSPPG